MKIHFELFGLYRYDEDCWGISFLTVGMMSRSFLSIDSDEDGWYINLFWLIESKIKTKG